MPSVHAALPTARRAPAPPPAAGLVPAVTRAMALLDRIARERLPMSLAQLTTELALPKSSVHGLCATLTSCGYLRRRSDGAFSIGPRVMSLAEAFVAGTDVAREFNALWLGADAGLTDETVVLSVPSGGDAVYVAARNSPRPLGLHFTVGMRLPACYTGSGRAVLAFQPPEAVRALYAGRYPPRLTGKGPGDLAGLAKELALIRQRGWSIDDENVQAGVLSFGAPVFDAGGEAVAGIAVCINKSLLGADRGRRHREAALAVAATLTERLGGRPADHASAPPRPRARPPHGRAA